MHEAISEKNKDFVQNLFAFPIIYNENDFKKPTRNVGVVGGYNDVAGSINTSSEEYCYTFPVIDPEAKSFLDKKLNLQKFFNKNKSISMCEICNWSQSLILFQSNTNIGSSGGPIIDGNFNLIGINLGNYYDNSEEDDINVKEVIMQKAMDITQFDIDVPEEKQNLNDKKAKNFNFCLNIFHPCLKKYFDMISGEQMIMMANQPKEEIKQKE